jgi:carboxypeptidase C (cathepsin A)
LTKTLQNQISGINADIKYLAEWIGTFVNRNNRWASPKFLIGESYGTTRVGLANALQESQWMYLNGVILVSPTDLGITVKVVETSLKLPYFAATAWHHKVWNQVYKIKSWKICFQKLKNLRWRNYCLLLLKADLSLQKSVKR